MRDMHSDYGVTINYVKAWRAREIALEIKRGRPSASYSKLPTYLYVLETTNTGSVVDLVTDANNSFLYMYLSLAASIQGWQYCRPIVVVDATFLTSAYRGTLITACTHDAAGKIFPLAFSVVDSENNDSWKWFFEKFRQTYGVREGMCIISDRHESIDNASRCVFLEIEHCFCNYHLLNNLKRHFKKNPKKISNFFLAAAYSYTEQEFDSNMAELDKVSVGIRNYLDGIGTEKWSRVSANVNRGDFMTSNSAESLNASNKKVKDLPITALLEYLHGVVRDWSHQGRTIGRDTFTILTTKYENKLRENNHKSLRMKVQPSTEWLYDVIDNDEKYMVDIERKTCSCRKFQMEELPCSHALAVINTKYLSAYDFCSHYYTKATIMAIYEGVVYPTGSKSNWQAPSEVSNRIVRPPIGRKKIW